jgi:hypothetical protein
VSHAHPLPAGPEPGVLEQLLALLRAPPARLTGQLPAKLPELVQRVADAIAKVRSDQDAVTVTRIELQAQLDDLANDLLRAAKILQQLAGYSLAPMVTGEEGILRALGGPEQIDRMWLAAMKTEVWRQRMAGSGRHTPIDTVGLPRIELLVAVALGGLCTLLLRPPPDPRNDNDLLACELLWRLSGGAPSAGQRRWRPHIAMARGHRPVREEARLWAQVMVDTWLTERGQRYAEALLSIAKTG